jgi:hypothetical protein
MTSRLFRNLVQTSMVMLLATQLACAGKRATPPPDAGPVQNPDCTAEGYIRGALPVTAASFDVDCTFLDDQPDGGPGVGVLGACNSLTLSLTFADGTTQTYSEASTGANANSNYDPGNGAGIQFTAQLVAADLPFSDGWFPTISISVPLALAQPGSVPVGPSDQTAGCWSQGGCIGVAVVGSLATHTNYLLGEVTGGNVLIESIGQNHGDEVKLHSSGITLAARPADAVEATCADGLIHHQP